MTALAKPQGQRRHFFRLTVRSATRPAANGFTLIELIVVMIVIALLAAVAVPNFVGAQDKARNAGVQTNAHTVQLALEQYGVDKVGVYPDDLNSVVGNPEYIFSYPRTPWGTQQAINSAIAADEAKVPGDEFGAGAIAAPSTTLHYGAIAYKIAAIATAKERYIIQGTGKKTAKAIVAIRLENFK
ncbi:MAG: prepilin-type N-terminal cleavage/methylation domain-containing protein [Cyanobacteria bacterium NC_groundwater_1444_Ag_S-0.65um_54_12]|nr:prepilin-type N-terminal cleavage/methylation domain-containing protein [Cyanobacteria bacterium NC_groundwater_1444_Ag_S-0.65um_54_12]